MAQDREQVTADVTRYVIRADLALDQLHRRKDRALGTARTKTGGPHGNFRGHFLELGTSQHVGFACPTIGEATTVRAFSDERSHTFAHDIPCTRPPSATGPCRKCRLQIGASQNGVDVLLEEFGLPSSTTRTLSCPRKKP